MGVTDFSSATAWVSDPKHVLFTLARYKFVSKMLAGKAEVAEIGCGDGVTSAIVQQTVGHLTLTDLPDAGNGVRAWNVETESLPTKFDAIYGLDVFEHLQKPTEVLRNIVKSLTPHGTLILGMPSLESQDYASPISREHHVNCMTGAHFKAMMHRHFRHVFMFGMNDEVVHTGFFPMCHYLIAVCCEPKAE